MTGFVIGLVVCVVLFVGTLWAQFAVGGREDRR